MQSLAVEINRRHRQRRRWTAFFIIVLALAVVLLGFGAFGFWQRYQATNNPNPTIETEVVTTSVDTPDETPPGEACTNYQVAAEQPRIIEIPRIGVKGCVQRVGIDQHRNIAVPTNIHVAGWYVNSPLPGQKGVSLIDGHVLGRYNDAIFVDLDRVSMGDEIKITKGDGTVLTFQVADRRSYPVEEVMNHLFAPLEGVESQLTLITCGGTYDKQAQTYDERVVVRAKLL